ncbi:phosphatase PAP2 family protein [Micromonospora mirobrigensis]|uniref:Undecaprenyl-diphosphatase n=1 Tax=Micromonospora mirobrigensis TaxID=262898 RepID=A0A1C4ZPA3_9ACTN|nr:phosphatase PAP2 family protein [Micromonospora mirobrigensis]SCF34732.1 undecaprenyl-diphosphatase [Micromonospora mirobrigensis]
MRASGFRSPAPAPSWRRRRLDQQHSLGLRLTLAAAAAFLVLVPFALLLLLILAAWPPLHDLDQSVTDALHGYALDHPGWVRAMSWWTDVFAPMPLRFAALVVVLWLLWRHARRLALWVVTTMTVGGLLGGLLKLLVGRHRPELLDPVARATGYSFPSGHALNAALAAGVLLLVFLPYARHRPVLRVVLWTVALLIAVVTGVSRVALGVHWTSDVVGGWLLGSAVVAATAAAFTTWRQQVARRPVHPTREGVVPELAEEPTRTGERDVA